MNIKSFNKTNFHKHTFCIFQEVDFELIKNIKLNFKSKSGSSYYFVENGVYRLSNHWSRVANCKWRLNNLKTTISRTKLGFAKWVDFYPDNDLEKLYFLDVNLDLKTVNYYHIQSENYSSDKVVRTSTETTKLIKQIRTLFEQTAWTKYLNEENSAVFQNKIIDKLINSNQSFQEIRREFL